MTIAIRNSAWFALLAFAAGCGGEAATNASTGAKEAVQRYYDALLHRNWQQAYAVLHPESQQICSKEEFVRLAESDRANMGFEPEKVNVWSCDEREEEAVARTVWTGHQKTILRRHKDVIVLRRNADSWRIVLPKNYGQ